MSRIVHGYKLFKLRKDGTLGPLFINSKQRVEVGCWLKAEEHKTPGYTFRPGWHCTTKPVAPHLSKTGRVWCKVSLIGVTKFDRPKAQGGLWLLAKSMRVDGIIDSPKIRHSKSRKVKL
jgi:hypothetical protein